MQWGLVGLVFVDLYAFGSQFNPVGKVSDLMPKIPVVEFLQENLGHNRFVAYQHEVLFGPNVPSIYGLSEAGGYSSVQSALYRQLIEADQPNNWWMNENENVIAFTQPSARLLDLLQVRYIVSPILEEDPGIRAEFVADDCSLQTGLALTSPLSGTFKVEQTAINRFDFVLQTPLPANLENNLTLRLWRGLEKQTLILETTPDLLSHQAGKVTAYFSPDMNAPGNTYVWELSPNQPVSGLEVCLNSQRESAIAVYGSEFSMVHHSGRIFVYERPTALPRAYIAYSAKFVPNDDESRALLLHPEFNPRLSVVVAEQVNLPEISQTPVKPVEIIDYKNSEVKLLAATSQPGILVLGDQYYPAWKAYLNGQPAPIIRVNFVQRGLMLPSGEHEVIFRLRPRSLMIGGGVFGLALTLIVMISFWAKKINVKLFT